MAYTEKSFVHTPADTALNTIYTNSAAASQVILLQVTNTGSTTQTITAKYRRSATSTDYSLVSGLVLPGKSTINLLTGKLVLEAGDSIKIQSDVILSLDVVGSVVERSA